MDIKTKFNCGDKVFPINSEMEKSWKECSFCDGSGNVHGKNEEKALCPVCGGRKGETLYGGIKWVVGEILTIGQIRVEFTCDTYGLIDKSLFDNYSPHHENCEESYMCLETGIRCGSVHNVSLLYPTYEEALAECNLRNNDAKNNTKS